MQYWFFGFPGSGKTYLAKLFSQVTGLPQFEGDDFHTEDDRKVIAAGAFTLAHRHSQLERISAALSAAGTPDAIVTHPLPDRNSRTLLRTQGARLVYVTAPLPLIRERLIARKGHHFDVDLLDAWIPRHWEEPVAEEYFVVRNEGGDESLEAQLNELYEWGPV